MSWRHGAWFALASLLGGAVALSHVSAQPHQVGIIGADNRVLVDGEGAPWDAIGQVNFAGHRRLAKCTGTLVSPTVVITAAHCVMDPFRRAPYPLSGLHFLAGARGSTHKGHGTAKCLHFPEGYTYAASGDGTATKATRVPFSAFAKDVVAVVLNESLSVAPAAVAVISSPSTELKLVHAAYPEDRRFRLSAHFDCRLLPGAQPEPNWLTNCDTYPASSGGPIFVDDGGTLRLLAIMVGAGRTANVALPASQWSGIARVNSCPSPSR